jgi:hypothetical protein
LEEEVVEEAAVDKLVQAKTLVALEMASLPTLQPSPTNLTGST